MLSRHLDNSDCVDEYLQDQLIVCMALAVCFVMGASIRSVHVSIGMQSGTSRIATGPLSLHTETAIHFARELTGLPCSLWVSFL